MAMTTRKNPATKAVQSAMAKAKKHDVRARREWELSSNTNQERGAVPTQEELQRDFSRRVHSDDKAGASKICHTHDVNGEEFQYIVIKRHLMHGWIGRGNQLIDEIECWKELAETPDADMLCPILKYFTSKSDKVTDTSETMQNNVIIIAQKAVKVGTAKAMCEKAEELNRLNGFKGDDAVTRYRKLESLSDKRNWWDAMDNRGNSGVIFDYSKRCYKAVFIDYAL